MENKGKVNLILILGDGKLEKLFYHALSDYFSIELVILEKNPSLFSIFKKRLKGNRFIGILNRSIFGLLFKVIQVLSIRKIHSIVKRYNLSFKPIPNKIVKKVSNINFKESMDILKRFNPDVIFVNNTRVISSDILNIFPNKYVHFHSGITHRYRGLHCYYWAKVNSDVNGLGYTIHLLDEKIDTGPIIFQKYVKTSPGNNITTYYYELAGESINEIKEAIEIVAKGNIKTLAPKQPSHIWMEPTIFQYVGNGFTKKVW